MRQPDNTPDTTEILTTFILSLVVFTIIVLLRSGIDSVPTILLGFYVPSILVYTIFIGHWHNLPLKLLRIALLSALIAYFFLSDDLRDDPFIHLLASILVGSGLYFRNHIHDSNQ